MAPYLLFGFLLAGILSVFLSSNFVARHLGRKGFGSILKAALLGIPLPICSCGVIPVTASLRDRGASRGASLSFLTSTPQTGVDSVLVTYSLLGPVFAVFRPIAALISGVVIGVAVEELDSGGGVPDEKSDAASDNSTKSETERQRDSNSSSQSGKSIIAIFHYGFVTLFGDVAGSLLIGLIVATVISVVVPNNWFEGALGTGLLPMLAAMAFGAPLYVCSTASVPMALAMILKGLSPGAALVFLMTGTATNAVSVATIWRLFGKRATIIYLTTIAVIAILLGFALNAIYSFVPGVTAELRTREGLSLLSQIAGAFLLLLVAAHFAVRAKRALSRNDAKTTIPANAIRFNVTGMTCDHCAKTVKDGLEEMNDVANVDVDLKSGIATITPTPGATPNDQTIINKIDNLGYQAKRVE